MDVDGGAVIAVRSQLAAEVAASAAAATGASKVAVAGFIVAVIGMLPMWYYVARINESRQSSLPSIIQFN